LVANLIAWNHNDRTKGRPVGYRDLTAALGPAQFPRPYSHSYRYRQSLVSALQTAMPGHGGRLPRNDWTKNMAFLVTAGPRSSTGYHLRIVSVTDRGDDILVRVREQTPTLRNRVTPGITYPHRLIVFPQTSKPVHVRWDGRP